MHDPRLQQILHHLNPPAGATAESWKKDRALLRETHAGLGIALHDVHHVAQIQMLKRLYDDGQGGTG